MKNNIINKFQPVLRTHAIELPFDAKRALHFFTPKGEEIWIKEWQPNYIWPHNGETQRNMVFTTGQDHELTYWCMVDFDQDNLFSRYTRVTPNSRSVLVEVKIIPIHDIQCEAIISYTLTALSDNGASDIEAFTEEKYSEMIDEWRDLIIKYCTIQ